MVSSVQNHHIQLKGSNYIVSAYMSIENTGDSYNIKPLADNMDLHTGGASDTKTPTSWGTKYKNALTCICCRKWRYANFGITWLQLINMPGPGRCKPCTTRNSCI